MTAQQILVDVFEQSGNVSDLNVYQADGVTFDLTTSGSVKLLQKLNEAQKFIASYKDPSSGYHLRLHSLVNSMFFKTYIIDDTVASVSDTTFPYSITLANSSGLLGTTDDRYNEWILELTSGSASGQVRLITDYTGATYTFYVHDDYDTDPAAADTVKLYKRWMYLLPATHAFVSEHISLPTVTDVSRADGNLVEVLKIEDVEQQKELDKSERTERFSAYINGYGDPGEWYRSGNKIYFNENQRTPKWFKLEYFRLPTNLVAATDEPEIPEMFHQGIVLHMLEWAYRRQQEFTAAYSMNQRLLQLLREQKSQYDVMGYGLNAHGTMRKE
jgi:hypothetical protein